MPIVNKKWQSFESTVSRFLAARSVGSLDRRGSENLAVMPDFLDAPR
jgi:hypothetical protein